MRKSFEIIFIFVICSIISSCIPALENSLTAKPHFRQVWWGNTKETVMFKEKGKPIHKNTGGSLVYKTRYNGIPVLLVFCFSNHIGIYRLRAAGYMTLEPQTTNKPDSVFRQELLKTLGEPTKTLEDGGMIWFGKESVIYTNAYRDKVDFNTLNSTRRISSSILSEPKPQHTSQWHLIAGYIDKEFYEEMDNIEDKHRLYAELTYYEKIFFGMFHRLQEP